MYNRWSNISKLLEEKQQLVYHIYVYLFMKIYYTFGTLINMIRIMIIVELSLYMCHMSPWCHLYADMALCDHIWLLIKYCVSWVVTHTNTYLGNKCLLATDQTYHMYKYIYIYIMYLSTILFIRLFSILIQLI